MGKLNQTPDGLLSFLASKTDGTNPSELLEAVRPVIDLLAFWAPTGLTVETLSTVFNGLDSDIGVVVPNGEVWIVQAAHGTFRNAGISGGEQVKLGLKITGSLNQNNVAQDVFFEGNGLEVYATFQLAVGVRISHFFERPFILRAGQGIAVQLLDFQSPGVAGNEAGTMAVLKNSLLF